MDLILFQKINQFAGRWLWLDTIAIFFDKYFEYVLIICLLLYLVKNLKKYWPMVIQAFLAAILARFVIVEIVRYLLPRARPFVENHVNLLIPYNQYEYSFPSGHAAFYFAISMAVFLYLKKVYPRPKFWWGAGSLFFLASFLIVISRVFVGIHWPSDILAGAVVGILTGWLINFFSRKVFPTALKQ